MSTNDSVREYANVLADVLGLPTGEDLPDQVLHAVEEMKANLEEAREGQRLNWESREVWREEAEKLDQRLTVAIFERDKAIAEQNGAREIHGTSKYGTPYFIRVAGKYGPQLYLCRKDGTFRYPMEDITESLDRHLTVHPQPAEYVADRTALTNEAKMRHQAIAERDAAVGERDGARADLLMEQARRVVAEAWDMPCAACSGDAGKETGGPQGWEPLPCACHPALAKIRELQADAQVDAERIAELEGSLGGGA
jgi:hypothetical protein